MLWERKKGYLWKKLTSVRALGQMEPGEGQMEPCIKRGKRQNLLERKPGNKIANLPLPPQSQG